MKPLSLVTSSLVIAACLGNPKTPAQSKGESTGNYTWTNVLSSGPWKKSYNFRMFSRGDSIWVFHHEGNWCSVDGKHWKKSTLNNPVNNLAFLGYMQFKDAVYGLGHFEGNSERYTFKPEIYRSRDFKRWEVIATNSNLPKRFFYRPFVFEGKIWIIGGDDLKRKYADAWSSPDGIHWTKRRDNLPFGPRSGSQVVRLRDTLYLLNDDVWISVNGLDWKLRSRKILPDEEVFGYSAEVFDDKIWLLGCNRNGRFMSQVLASTDGITWTTQAAPWSPRGGIASVVHKGRIWMTGGKYGGTPDRPEFIYSNDLWTLAKK